MWVTAALIVALAFAARIYNVNWDENTHLHPDERGLTMVATNVKLPSSPAEYLSQEKSPLNPYNAGSNSYVYGNLPLTLTKVAAVIADREDYDSVVLVGRFLSALFSAATVGLVFLCGRRVFGSTAGLLGAVPHGDRAAGHPARAFLRRRLLRHLLHHGGALLRAAGAAGGQDARLCPCRAHGRARHGLQAHGGCHFAGRCGCGGCLRLARDAAGAEQSAERAVRATSWPSALFETMRRPLGGVVIAALLALLAFRLAQPYAFETPKLVNPMSWLDLSQKWTEDQKQQTKLLGGTAAFPPTIQWIDRTPYVDPLREMVLWGMGPGFGIAAWAALAYGAWRLLRRGDLRVLLPLAFVALYFGFMGRQFTLYMRYFLPLYPALALLAGFGLVELMRGASELARRRRMPDLERAGYATVGLVLLASLLAGVAYLHIYRQPVTRVEASRWLLRNLQPGTTVATEHWDEGLPLQLPTEPPHAAAFRRAAVVRGRFAAEDDGDYQDAGPAPTTS